MNQTLKRKTADTKAAEYGGYEFGSFVTGISVSTLYALVCRKRIPHVRINRRFVRFCRSDLLAWLDSKKVEPNALRPRTRRTA